MSVYLYMFSVLSVLSFLFRKTVFLSNECYPMTLQWLTYIHRVPLSGTEIAFSEQCPLLCTAQTSTMDMRVLTALEFITNSSAYSCASPNFVLRNLPILTPHYKQLLRETVTDKSESEMIHLFGLSKAVGIPLQSYCSPDTGTSLHLYTLHILPSLSYTHTFRAGAVTVIWTTSSTESTTPDHFVLLVPVTHVVSTGRPIDSVPPVPSAVSASEHPSQLAEDDAAPGNTDNDQAEPMETENGHHDGVNDGDNDGDANSTTFEVISQVG